MANGKQSPNGVPSSSSSSTARPREIGALVSSFSTSIRVPKAERKRHRPRPPISLTWTSKSSSSSRPSCPARSGDPMIEALTPAAYDAVLRQDLATFAARAFYDLNPQAELAMGWHIQVIAAKLAAVRRGEIRRLIINLPPRHLKSHLGSIAFPAWCLGHNPSLQILCVSYAQELADKLARDCRSIMMSSWYRRIFPTRLAQNRQAVQEFVTTCQGYRLGHLARRVFAGRGGRNQ